MQHSTQLKIFTIYSPIRNSSFTCLNRRLVVEESLQITLESTKKFHLDLNVMQRL